MSDLVTRRRFLRHLTLLGGVALLRPASAHADSAPTWISIGPTDSFPPGKTTHVVLPDADHGEEVYVTPSDAGEYHVLSARCTHKGCLVNWNAKKKQFDCPCHGGVFDQTGTNIGGPPPCPLTMLPVKVDDQGHLCVQILTA